MSAATPPPPLNADEQRLLLAWARETLRSQLELGQEPALAGRTFPAALTELGGAFVTLRRGHELRGCIGTFEARRPLVETVREMALAAASHDPRFAPVAPAELGQLTLEISVLSPRWPVQDPLQELAVGRDGICVSRGPRRGVLLPQVASEYGWDLPTFLGHTCRKAGLPSDAWRQPGTKIERFTAQVFSEPIPDASAERGR